MITFRRRSCFTLVGGKSKPTNHYENHLRIRSQQTEKNNLNMQNKQDKRKKTKKEIKVHDLKPSKDAKGGWNPQPDPPGRTIPPPC
jgi:hypothetical protein